jgi:hypothetical protein
MKESQIREIMAMASNNGDMTLYKKMQRKLIEREAKDVANGK